MVVGTFCRGRVGRGGVPRLLDEEGLSMDAMNFNVIERGEVRESNYRLLNEPVKLMTLITPVLEAPGFDRWEDDGGLPAPLPYEVTTEELFRKEVRIKLGHRQRAARMAVPRESIRVVSMGAPAPVEVVMARYEGRSEEEVKIAELEAKIKALLGIARAPIVAEQRRQESIARLEALFEGRRTR